MVDAPGTGIVKGTMPDNATRRRKLELSDHQKQIRFFTRLSVVICSSVVFVFFWFMSRSNFITH